MREPISYVTGFPERAGAGEQGVFYLVIGPPSASTHHPACRRSRWSPGDPRSDLELGRIERPAKQLGLGLWRDPWPQSCAVPELGSYSTEYVLRRCSVHYRSIAVICKQAASGSPQVPHILQPLSWGPLCHWEFPTEISAMISCRKSADIGTADASRLCTGAT